MDSAAFNITSSITTGLPSGTQLVGRSVMIVKSAGTTSRTINVDLMGWRYDNGARG
jgi:hypothetical protein